MREDSRTEFKREYTAEIRKTIIAFANCEGGSIDFSINKNTILELIKESSGFSYEKELSVIQELTFEYSVEVFGECGVKFDEMALRSFGAINENGQYTNLALLMSDQCPHIIKMATFQGRDKRIFRDRLVADGSVFKQISTAVDFISKYNRLRAEIVGYKREDRYDYPMDCIRELLYNAIIHRDYSYDSPIIISVMEDRIEIVNIGGLYGNLSKSELGTGISACRNKNLAEVFYRLELVEAFGTGIMKVNSAYDGCRRYPEFRPGNNSFLAILPNMNTEREEEYEAKVRERSLYTQYGRPVDREVTEREERALNLAKAKGSIVRADLEEKLNISQATAILLLREMTEKGLLRKEGAGKNTKYMI